MGIDVVTTLAAIVVATVGAFGASFAVGLVAGRLARDDARPDPPQVPVRAGEPPFDG
jgi:hypothetical protein